MNLCIKEIYTNKTENYIIGDSGEFKTFTASKGKLFNALQKEHGRCVSKMYRDNSLYGPLCIGWVFEKIEYYEDTQEPYLSETWVKLTNTLL